MTLDDEQNNKLKSAVSDALGTLEKMENDLLSPSEENKDKLNEIAALFGISSYQIPTIQQFLR